VLTNLKTGQIGTVVSSTIGAIALQWQTQLQYLVNEPLICLYATLVIDNRAYGRIAIADQIVVREELERAFRELDQ